MSEQTNIGKDKTTVGVTAVSQGVLDELIGREDIFSSESGAFKSAVALAIRLELDYQDARTSLSTTKWNAGSLADLVEFVQWYLQVEYPVRTVESLGDAELRYISERVDLGASIEQIFDIEEFGDK